MDVIVAAEAALVLAPLVYRADSQVKQKGDIIHFPQISELTVSTKTQGSEVTPSAVTESEVTVTVNTWKYKDNVPLASNCYSKQGEFGENLNLKGMTTPSRSWRRDYVPCILRDDDIVRTLWKHKELDRNVLASVN